MAARCLTFSTLAHAGVFLGKKEMTDEQITVELLKATLQSGAIASNTLNGEKIGQAIADAYGIVIAKVRSKRAK